MNERNLNDLIYQLKNFAFSNFSYTQDLDFNVLFGRMSHQLNQLENNINEKIIAASQPTSKKENVKKDDINKKDQTKKIDDFISVNQPIPFPSKIISEKRSNKFLPILLASSQFGKPGSEPSIKTKNSKEMKKHPTRLKKSNSKVFIQQPTISFFKFFQKRLYSQKKLEKILLPTSLL